MGNITPRKCQGNTEAGPQERSQKWFAREVVLKQYGNSTGGFDQAEIQQLGSQSNKSKANTHSQRRHKPKRAESKPESKAENHSTEAKVPTRSRRKS